MREDRKTKNNVIKQHHRLDKNEYCEQQRTELSGEWTKQNETKRRNIL